MVSEADCKLVFPIFFIARKTNELAFRFSKFNLLKLFVALNLQFYSFSGTYLVFENGQVTTPVVKERIWVNNKFNFDNVAKGMLTLFTVSTFEGWPAYVWN